MQCGMRWWWVAMVGGAGSHWGNDVDIRIDPDHNEHREVVEKSK